MPTIRAIVAVTTGNALQNQKFAILTGPAVINLWAAAVTKTDAIGLSVDNRELVVQGTNMNIEASADVIDTDRDQLVFNEVVQGGQLYMPVTVTTEAQYLLSIKYL